MPNKTVKDFSKPVCSALAHYVYCLVDPRNKEVFYVGKGRENRVFDRQYRPDHEHEDEAREKAARIQEIEASGREVERYILCHDLDEETASIVESCVISLLRSGLLKNAALPTPARGAHSPEGALYPKGPHYPKWGVMSVDKVAAKYSLPMQDDCFTDPVMVVNISKNLRTAATLYDATRGDWTASEERLTRRLGEHYVIAEYDGVLADVFKPQVWKKLENGKMRFENTPGFEKGAKEYDELFKRYCNRLVGFRQTGDASPIHYFNM
jgi:hypothetical protein